MLTYVDGMETAQGAIKSFEMILVKMLPNSPCILMAALLISSASGSCKLECSTSWVDDCEICNTVHFRDCTITMKIVLVPKMIRKCYPTRLSFLDGIECKDGAMMRCKVR